MMATATKPTVRELTRHLWRGGKYAHWWSMTENGQTKESLWFDVETPISPSPTWGDRHQYFAVHPGTVKGSPYDRVKNETAAAINCLFGDFDAKDEVLPDEYAPFLPGDFGTLKLVDREKAIKAAQVKAMMLDLSKYKARAWVRVQSCPLAPTWTNDSGGGYQCFWWLADTVKVDDSNRDRLKALQAAWAALIGADTGVKDLARVLRIPGSANVKAHFAPNYPKVTVTEYDPTRLYTLTEFEALTGIDDAWMAAQRAQRPERKPSPADSVIAQFNDAYRVGALLEKHGYQRGRTFGTVERYSRPGREKGQTSVVVWSDLNRSYHHSSSDPLHCADGHSWDAFDVFRLLEHGGHEKAAFVAAKKALGLWKENTGSKPSATPTSDDGGPSDDTDDVSNSKNPRSSKGDGERKPTQAEILYNLASDHAEIFTAQDGTAYAFVPIDGRRECYRLNDSNFSGWLTALYRAKTNGAMPGAEGRKEAIAALTWDARATRRDVFVRVGGHGGKVYIDLGTEEWDAIEIDENGWRLLAVPPVAFRRPASLKPLPLPMGGARLDLFRKYANLEDDDWPLVAGWLVAAANPSGPYPILALAGEQGTAKSTTIRALKEILDPAAAGLRGQPEDIRDLWVGANNGWLLAYDNVSHLNNDVSDALCRLATGGGYAKRANYTDDGEFVMDAQRPVAINGIGDIITRPDLMDRTILICPPVITESKRRNEKEFWAGFDADRPKLLGALLDAVSLALRNINTVRLETMPRMADFARLATAAEPAIGEGISFMDAYNANREEAHATVVETSTLGEHLRALVLLSGIWEGTATELLKELDARASDSEKRSHSWPKVPNRIKPALQRLAPSLRHIGVTVEYPKRTDKGGTKRIQLVRVNT